MLYPTRFCCNPLLCIMAVDFGDLVKFSLDNCLDDLFILYMGLNLAFPFIPSYLT